jgi:hypothetical protein
MPRIFPKSDGLTRKPGLPWAIDACAPQAPAQSSADYVPILHKNGMASQFLIG